MLTSYASFSLMATRRCNRIHSINNQYATDGGDSRVSAGAVTTHPLAELVARVLRNEPEAVVEFVEIARPRVRSIQRHALQHSGTSGIWISEEEMTDMVEDGVLDLLERLRSWRAEGGAAPWNWATKRLRAIAFESLGQFSTSIDDAEKNTDAGHRATTAFAAPGTPDFEELAQRVPEARQLADALAQTGRSRRDIEIWWEVTLERAAGNARAALTVATGRGLGHSCVRQATCRVQRRLRHVVSQPGWEDVAALPLFAN